MAKKWGFALIELPVVARVGQRHVSEYEDRERRIDAEQGALLELQKLITQGKVPSIPWPGHHTAHTWPLGVTISEVKIITRLYGRQTYPVFQHFVELEADSEQQLQQAFEYLEHYCGVEGYGGGG